jgi:type IV secretion system protein VirB8
MTDHETYYAAATSWADDRVASDRRARRIAWTIAGIATAIAFLLALTVAVLLPLKTVEPYVVTVDRQTGAVEVATKLSGGRLTQNEAVIEAELANYVRARETFDATDLALNYRRVQMLSAPDVRAAYVAAMAATNPASPLRTLTRGDMVAIKIKSVSLLGPNTALVRFDAARSAANGGVVSNQAYAAAVSFGFSGRPLRLEDRFDNPLGFQVTRYRRDAEGLTP